MSETSDILEVASNVEEESKQGSIQKIIKNLEGPILSECEECGHEIPLARREFCKKIGMKATTCVDCQSQIDIRNKHYAR